MILPIILFIVIILAIAILIMFSVYILLPSINIQEENSDDPVIPQKSKQSIFTIQKIQKTASACLDCCRRDCRNHFKIIRQRTSFLPLPYLLSTL